MPQKNLPSPFEKDLSEKSDVSIREENRSQIALQVTAALATLDRRYRENIADYARTIHELTHEIEKQRIALKHLYEERKPYAEKIESLESETEASVKMLEYLTQEWIEEKRIVSALESELKALAKAHERKKILAGRNETLQRLSKKIEETEESLLEFELEKENLLLRIEPLNQKIKSAEKSLEELESAKRSIEASRLHDIALIGGKPR